MNKLSGFKTYIAGALAILSAVGAYANGDVSGIDAAQLAVTGLIGIFLRNGIKA